MTQQFDAQKSEQQNGSANKDNKTVKLHIFINKIKYDEADGVKPTMTGRELAALVPVNPAVIEITRAMDGFIPVTKICALLVDLKIKTAHYLKADKNLTHEPPRRITKRNNPQ